MEPGYDVALELAEKLNHMYVYGNHPCIVNRNKDCCRANGVATAKGDRERIREDIDNGVIPLKVVQTAKNNVEKGVNHCPFFDARLRQCLIYESRPIVCISAGGLYIPASEFNVKSMLRMDSLGDDDRKGLPRNSLGSTMCEKCDRRERKVIGNQLVDTLSIQAGQIILNVINATRQSMEEFVQSL